MSGRSSARLSMLLCKDSIIINWAGAGSLGGHARAASQTLAEWAAQQVTEHVTGCQEGEGMA